MDVSLPLVFVNGEPADEGGSAVLSPRDRGFTLADGLFETMRVRNGVVFRLVRHLTRLAHGLDVLSIPEPPALRRWLERAIAHGGRPDVAVRLTITRGAGPGGLAPPPDVRPTTVITVVPMPIATGDTFSRGLRAIVASGRRNPRAMSVGLKTLSYTDSVLAWIEAQRAGADEAVLLDTDGHCSEATASNLFVHCDGHLLTPPTSCAALPGITRATVMELATILGIPVEERAFGLDRLLAADEAFLTSSLRGIAPLQTVDGQPLGTGAHELATRLTHAYESLVDEECGVV
jgi:branched-chain amino acid aminotransferase